MARPHDGGSAELASPPFAGWLSQVIEVMASMAQAVDEMIAAVGV